MNRIIYIKFLATSVLLFVGVNLCNAQALFNYDETSEFGSDGLERVMSNGKHGFIDFDGNEVIPLKYEDAFNFSDGLAPVKLNGKWGYIDVTGKEITPFKYDVACNFDESVHLAPVIINEKYGFIDKTGKEITPLKYNVPEEAVKHGIRSNPGDMKVKYYLYKKIGNRASAYEKTGLDEGYDEFYARLEEWMLQSDLQLNPKTHKVYHPHYVYLSDNVEFHEGLALVWIDCPELEQTWYEESQKRREETSNRLLGRDKIATYPNRCGFINTKGEEVIPLMYYSAYAFNNDRIHHSWDPHAWVIHARRIDNSTFFVDILGNEYESGSSFSKDRDKAQKRADKAMKKLEKTSGKKPTGTGKSPFDEE